MQLSEEDKERTLLNLIDMFNRTPRQRLQEVCMQNNWKLEDCIDNLIKTGGSNENVAPNEMRHSVTWTEACFQFQNGAIPKGSEGKVSPKKQQASYANRGKSRRMLNNQSTRNSSYNSQDEKRIGELIESGYKVMVLMRGASGSGKSTLAKSLVERTLPLSGKYRVQDFVLSTDDLWYDAKGNYKFCSERIGEMHGINHRRALDKAVAGWSPLVIDNTNMQVWEMLPYVHMAVQQGYIVDILEPNTPWRNSAGKLYAKSQHGVPRENIQRTLDKYERTTVRDLMKLVTNVKHAVPLPQMRLVPPVIINRQQEVETNERFQIFQNAPIQDTRANNDHIEDTAKAVALAKEQRTSFRRKAKIGVLSDAGTAEQFSLSDQVPESVSWQPYEDEFNQFWLQNQKFAEEQKARDQERASPPLKPSIWDLDTAEVVEKPASHEKKTLLDLLREDDEKEVVCLSTPETHKIIDDSDAIPNTAQASSFEKHRINCPNENAQFISLRQIYPNKQLSGLWDLFVKCNGDIDWAVDILLKEDELAIGDAVEFGEDALEQDENTLSCRCGEKGTEVILDKPTSLLGSDNNSISKATESKPQRQRNRQSRFNQRNNTVMDEVRAPIENLFVLGPEHYSEHVRKIRDMRNAALGQPSIAASAVLHKEVETQTDAVEDSEDTDQEQEEGGGGLLEVTLANDFVQQLSSIFKSHTTLTEKLSEEKRSPLKVFMPRALAKELYMLCLESAYNQAEEERQRILREDEEFARLLKIPKYEHFEQSPSNTRELLDMELAWMIYNNDKRNQKQEQDIDQLPVADLAAYLTRLKLYEGFPEIPRDTLLDILAAHGNRYGETVEVLRSTMVDGDKQKVLTQEQLLACVASEKEMLNQVELEAEVRRKEQQQQPKRVSSSSQLSNIAGGAASSSPSPAQAEEAKRVALCDFEEMRNLAAHHCQLKAECYQKAKEAVQRNNGAVAVYYSEIANLHKRKIDMFNHRAANCIMEVHKFTQNNPDLLDLHYLHALEAIGCLDLFLDRHITALRSASHVYKHVFIITGRGLHSAGGVSTIKNKVKNRLKKRCLRWSEVNPGLLKVKIYSASRHSKNVL